MALGDPLCFGHSTPRLRTTALKLIFLTMCHSYNLCAQLQSFIYLNQVTTNYKALWVVLGYNTKSNSPFLQIYYKYVPHNYN